MGEHESGPTAPPAWSPLPDAAAHDQFLALVDAVVDRADLRGTPEDDGRTLRLQDDEGTDLRLDLGTLAVLCRDAPRDDWAEMVVAHMAPLLAPDPMDQLEQDADALRDAVRVRLYPTSVLDEQHVAPPSREIADGLSEVVVVDTAETVMVVDTDRFGVLELSDAELFALGRDNLRTHEPVAAEHHTDGPVELFLAESDSFYTATWAVLLDELVDLPPHGALVTIPSRHALMAHPLRDAEAIKAVQVLLGVAHRHFAEAPGNLTPDLYWYRDGRLRLLPTAEQDDGQLGFAPRDDFLDVLNQLVEA